MVYSLAWRVDLDVTLSSLEPLIAGTRRLIDLAMRSPHPNPPQLVFTSTFAIFLSEFFGIIHPIVC